MKEDLDKHWALDRRVSLGLIFSVVGIIITLGVQTYIVGQWVGTTNQRLLQIEQRMEAASLRSQAVDGIVAAQSSQIAVLVARIDEQTRQLDRLFGQVESTNELLRSYLQRNGG